MEGGNEGGNDEVLHACVTRLSSELRQFEDRIRKEFDALRDGLDALRVLVLRQIETSAERRQRERGGAAARQHKHRQKVKAERAAERADDKEIDNE